MTRIFEALKKSQARAGALPFPPAEAPSRRPVAPGRPAGPAAASAPPTTSAPPATPAPIEGIAAPRIETRPSPALPEDVVREMTALRIGLESALASQKTRIVMFLGSMTGEGVTTVATQFASVLGFDGRGRVLLLDAQTAAGVERRPARAAPHGLPVTRGGPPLIVARLSDEVRRAGGRAPTAVRAFLTAVAAQYDWVVVDGAPVLDSPESVDLAPLVDGVVLVVRSGHTKRPVIVRAVELLRKSGARVLGTVLNRRRLEIPDFIYRRV